MGYFFWEAWNDSQQQLAMLERIKNERTKEVDALQHRLENNKEYLDLVLKDPPTFFRNEARQRLGYVSTGEIVIKVEPPPPARPTLTVPRR